jgi:hypothetical protein
VDYLGANPTLSPLYARCFGKLSMAPNTGSKPGHRHFEPTDFLLSGNMSVRVRTHFGFEDGSGQRQL